MLEKSKRFMPDIKIGLSSAQVNERIANGEYNKSATLKTKSYLHILKDNVCTLFNLINLILAVAVFMVGSYKNTLFLILIVINTLIGTVQEIRAKKTIDKLSIVNTATVSAVRNGKVIEIPIDEIVLDDVLFLSSGQQIPTDCIVVDGYCEVNESLLTGESEPVYKANNDSLISGSFIVSGSCTVIADKVGNDNYASHIYNGAKYVKKIDSKIMNAVKFIIKTMSVVIFPVGTLLFLRQYMANDYADIANAVVSTVAALVGMIPEGLVLLTSTVLAVGVMRLSKQKVLVQEMYCIEALARVDVLCLDKTGTITEGSMEVLEARVTKNYSIDKLENALNAIAEYSTDNNSTMNAIKSKYTAKTDLVANEIIAFSSERKWSGISFENNGAFVLGADEFIFGKNNDEIKEITSDIPKGYRVLAIGYSENNFINRELPKELQPVGVIVLKDKIRKEAKATLEYFDKQGVDIKVISGDNVETVASVATEAGLKNADKIVDATTLKTEDDIYEAVERYSVFGRVTPNQKLQMVQAIKNHGHTVAMTGDGVNDVLALKEADCSVAMASGSQAARCVSQLVLLDSNFASMPKVVAEGRRSINNIQRSASLFLVKTVFSTLLSLIFVFYGASYPFMPIQMTLISAFCIGFPSFVLALEPNENKIEGNFLLNIFKQAIPGGVTVAFSVVLVTILGNIFNFSDEFISTLAVSVTAFVGLMVVYKTSFPFNCIRTIMFAISVGGMVWGVAYSKHFFCDILKIGNIFGFVNMSFEFVVCLAVCVGFAFLLFLFFNFIVSRVNTLSHRKNKIFN